MSDSSPFLILKQPCGEAIDWVVRKINAGGMTVIRTFDLQIARHDQPGCPCPHHGTVQCDCQMVVLLVYVNGGQTPSERQPISIVAHGCENQTWFSMVDTSQQRVDRGLDAAIRRALTPQIFSLSGLENPPHANAI